MAAYNKELARKIIRLLESDHDGEVLSAVNKLRGMAQGQGQNLDEMLAAIYGSAAPKASGSSPFTAWDASETLRKARAKAAADAAAAAAEARAEAFRQEHPSNSEFWNRSSHRFTNTRLAALQERFDEYGDAPLSPWETDFVNDILTRGNYVLSDKQIEVIDKILAKYKNFAARNGDEKSFWGA